MSKSICTPVKKGIQLRVRLTPKSSRNTIEGVGEHSNGPVVLARVRALPDKGRANEALIELLAAEFKLPKTSISLAFGTASRLKTLLITGDTAELQKRFETWAKGNI